MASALAKLRKAIDIMHRGSASVGNEWRMYGCLLQWCVETKAMGEGNRIRVHMIKTGFKPDVYLQTKFVILLVKCGRVAAAREMFDKMSERNVVSWNTMISGYAEQGNAEEALTLFIQMQHQIQVLDPFTLATILRACTFQAEHSNDNHKQVHVQVIRRRFESDIVLLSTLIDAYAKSGCMDYACQLFDKMPQRDVVSWTAMLSAYVKCGRLEEAFDLFREMPERDVVSWNAMIEGYAQHGLGENALMLFLEMQRAGLRPSASTFPSILGVCSDLSALEQGKQLHVLLIKFSFLSYSDNVMVGSALVDMYAKCGSLNSARQAFERLPHRNVICWTAMIDGYGKHGHAMDSIQVFEQMQSSGTSPNLITFVSVLSACSHAGLVEQGWHYFNTMTQIYSLTPRQEHYACMVDLLGRAGQLGEAYELIINNMPIEPGPDVWGALLGACRVHDNLELGKLAAERLFNLNAKKAGAYVVLSNIYAAAGRWSDASQVRKIMKEKGVIKEPGCSWIEVDKQVHTFHVEDRSHPRTQEIYAMVEEMYGAMKEAGYLANTHSVLYDVDEEDKQHILCHHSEKLAVAFALLNTSPTRHIRIMKNLRMCVDCHTAIKLISKIFGREIVIRDANRFHYFKDGLCSCCNYW